MIAWGGRRYYDPETGRWTTPDPANFADGPNLYTYLHHNPLNAFDAYGLLGEAYRDSCNVGANSSYFAGISNEYSPMFENQFDPVNDRAEYVSHSLAYEGYHRVAGAVHGGIDFCINQINFYANAMRGPLYYGNADFVSDQISNMISIAILVGSDECGECFDERMKGPNYSHYHLNGKPTHYSPRPNAPNPGFNYE